MDDYYIPTNYYLSGYGSIRYEMCMVSAHSPNKEPEESTKYLVDIYLDFFFYLFTNYSLHDRIINKESVNKICLAY